MTTLNSGVSAVVLDQPTMASWIAQSKQPGGANIMDLLKIDAGKSPADIESEVIEVETNLVDNTDTSMETPVEVEEIAQEPEIESLGTRLAMADFLDQFGEGLLEQVRSQNPPVYAGAVEAQSPIHKARAAVMDGLKRKPFHAQAEAVQAVCKLLLDHGEPAAVINAEMGTGKTMMAICVAAVMQEQLPRTLIISPPHLVYKWRREIMDTVPNAKVWVLNGQDTLRKLLAVRMALQRRGVKSELIEPSRPEFFVLGRVRMRMGFHWKPSYNVKRVLESINDGEDTQVFKYASCPDCGVVVTQPDSDGGNNPISLELANVVLSDNRCKCSHCGSQLWTLIRKGSAAKSMTDLCMDALKQMPTIGEKTAQKLLKTFGEELISGMLGDNVYEFLNLMDENGDLVFNDRQAARMERRLATFEFSIGEGGYQPTEFIKRYLPKHYFGLLVVDEGHEYKNEGSAQGQAMGVLASQCRKVVLLTGTLMGGYADDLYSLLWRMNPGQMVADGFKPSKSGSMSGAIMNFMREHGVLKDIYKETAKSSHRTAKGKTVSHRTSKAPGFGPKGIMRYVLPITVFLKLKDIGQKVLPPYQEFFTPIPMTTEQGDAYGRMSRSLIQQLKQALVKGDVTLLGVVMQVLLAWPDCSFRNETVRHPRTKAVLCFQPAVFQEIDANPKEEAMIKLCKEQKEQGRRTLVYSVYSGTRDTTSRLKNLLEAQGLKVVVLRASVDASKREDWVMEQVERGIDVLVCNPELVKTGLDLLEFPTIVFMQSGFNVYTVQQAARRSWRIGQKKHVEVHYLGFQDSAQMDCLKLMAKKIAVSQSTSGDMPDSGLDVLNDSGESIEMALAKKLMSENG